ncbi:MAG: hypothetical protein WC988_00990 [Patescibacteria group bacterium]
MPFKILGLSKGDEGQGKKSQLETEIEKRGRAELSPRRDVVSGSEVKTYRDERGILEYREVDAVITRNCEMDLVNGAYIIAPKEGRKYLEGGEAKVSVIDTPDARIVMVFRPSDEHFSQDGIGVSVVKDIEGGLRVGTALCDGKTRVKVSAALPSYVSYGEDRVYYSRAEQYAAFASGYFPRALALGLKQNAQTGQYEGNSAKVVAGALGEIDKLNSDRTMQTPYGMEREVGGMPWGTTTVQMSAIRVLGGQMAIEVMNMGKGDDLGENALLQSPGAVSKMGNTVGDRPLELGRFGTPQGFKAERLLAASRAGTRSGVAVVPAQVFVQVSDGFKVPKGGIRTNGGFVSLEQLLSLPSEDVVAFLQQNATLAFGNEKASHDDGTVIAVVPRSVLQRNGFDYVKAYGQVKFSQASPVKEGIPSIVPTASAQAAAEKANVVEIARSEVLSNLSQTAAGVLEEVIREAEAATPVEIENAVMQSNGIVAAASGPSPEEVAVSEVPEEILVNQDVAKAATLIAQRLGVAIESHQLTGESGEVFVQVAQYLEAKMSELKALMEAGMVKGVAPLEQMAKLFEIEIDYRAVQTAKKLLRVRGRPGFKDKVGSKPNTQSPSAVKESDPKV